MTYQWFDDLIWCPSQCYCDVIGYDGKVACLYLRWRFSDPWTGDIIWGYQYNDLIKTTEVWQPVDIGWLKDTELDKAKKALIRQWELTDLLRNADLFKQKSL